MHYSPDYLGMHGSKLRLKMIISSFLDKKDWVHSSDLVGFGSRQQLLLGLNPFALLISEVVKNGLLSDYYDVITDFRHLYL